MNASAAWQRQMSVLMLLGMRFSGGRSPAAPPGFDTRLIAFRLLLHLTIASDPTDRAVPGCAGTTLTGGYEPENLLEPIAGLST